MKLSVLAWVHNLIFLGAALFAVSLGVVSVYAEASAYEKGRRAGEARGAFAATAKYMHRLTLQELNELKVSDL